MEHLIHFQERPVKDLRHPKKYGFIITNPPYGERLESIREARNLYRKLGENFSKLSPWQIYIITTEEEFERLYGKKADKVRKLYNGMLKCNLYLYFK